MKRPGQKGISLVEVILAMAVFAIAVPLLFATYSLSFKFTQHSQEVSIAANIAQEKIEQLRLTGFDALTVNSTPTAVAVPELTGGFSKTYVTLFQGNDKIKEARITIYWKNRPESRAISLTTLIGQGGIH